MEKKMSLSLSLYQCALCTLKFPFDKVKYSKDGKKLICIDCYAKLMKKDQKQANENNQKPGIKLRAGQTRDGSIKVMCANCNYKFFYRPNFNPICPYCGKKSIRKYEELTAEKLIKESSKDY